MTPVGGIAMAGEEQRQETPTRIDTNRTHAVPMTRSVLTVPTYDPADARLDDPAEDPVDPGDRPGPAIDGFEHFARRAWHRILDRDEEQDLGRRMEAGLMAQRFLDQNPDLPEDMDRDFRRQVRDGRRAADTLTRHNVRLVMAQANRLRHRCSPALEFEDLVQEGYLGLAHAVSKWDYRRRLKFSTYATWWIRQSMDRALDDRARTIRLPVHMADKIRKMRRTKVRLERDGFKATKEAIAQAMECSTDEIERLHQFDRRVMSLDRPAGRGGGPLGQFVGDSGLSPESIVVGEETNRAIHEVIYKTLEPREQFILIRRFGLGGWKRKTLEEIGAELGVTRERVRQLEKASLARLLGSADRTDLRELADISLSTWRQILTAARQEAERRDDRQWRRALA